MTQTTLRAVTLKTVANYAQAAERAVGAYRRSGHRLISLLQRGVDRAAQQGSERLAPRLANALSRASGNVGGLAAKGLDAVSRRTEQAIELGSTHMTTQLGRVADLAEGVDNRVLVSGVHAAVRISLPGAKAALALSQRVAAGADKLAGVGQKTARKPAHTTAVKPKAKAAASRRAASVVAVVAAVEGPVKAAVQRTASTVKRAKKAVPPVLAEASAAVRAKASPKARSKVAGKAAAKPVARPATPATPAKAARARRPAKSQVLAAAAPADATSAA